MKINYYDKPGESLEGLLTKYAPPITILVEELTSSPIGFRYVYQDLLDILKWAFEVKKIRTKKIQFVFHKDDKKVHTMQIRHFLSNMILWQAFIEMDCQNILDASYIFDFEHFNIDEISAYIDDKILPNHKGDFASRNKTVDEICYHITAISNAFCLLMGMSISIYDIQEAEKRNPEMSEIIFGGIDPALQPVEVEEELNRRTKKLIAIFSEDKMMNSLKPLFLSGKNLSNDQFKEMLVKIGLKSDINGNTIPVTIDANLMITGLNKPSYAYINSLSGRKALILTKTAISSPGAFGKKLNHLATSASYLRSDYEPCDSVHFVDYHIRDDLFLKTLNGRYYYNERGELHILSYSRDKHLIGKIVPFKSPCTCSSDDGICCQCYGELFDINRDLFSCGSLSSTKLSEPLGQRVLSSKHSQVTDSNMISFNKDFDGLFELLSSEISLKEDAESDEQLFIILDDVHTEEGEDGDNFFVTDFHVVNLAGKTIYHVGEEHGASMYLSDQLLALYRKTKDKSKPISLDNFDSDGDVLFTVEIKNKELTDPIKVIQKLINSNDRLGTKSISELCQAFAENLISIGIKYDLVHAECVVRSLLRKKSNELEFPDWSRAGDPNDFQIMRLNKALFKNPSAIVSLSYGFLRKQLISPELYSKSAPSHLDTLFVSKLSDYID